MLKEIRIVIDITNPMDNLPAEGSGAQRTALLRAIGPWSQGDSRLQGHLPRHSWGNLIDPATGMARDVFFCGDDGEAKEVVASLIEDLGFRAVD